MKKTLLLLAILISAVLTVSAQSDDSAPKLSVGFSVGGTVGPHAADLPVGGGIHFKLEYPLVENQVSLMVTAGYTFFVSSTGYQYESDTYDGSYSSGELVNFVPIMVGARFYVANRIFVQGDVGASFNINSTGYTNSKTALIVSPSAGYALPFGSSRFGLDLSLAYEDRFDSGSTQAGGPTIGNWGMAEFRLAFRFGL
jgi:hypothetical protein